MDAGERSKSITPRGASNTAAALCFACPIGGLTGNNIAYAAILSTAHCGKCPHMLYFRPWTNGNHSGRRLWRRVWTVTPWRVGSARGCCRRETVRCVTSRRRSLRWRRSASWRHSGNRGGRGRSRPQSGRGKGTWTPRCGRRYVKPACPWTSPARRPSGNGNSTAMQRNTLIPRSTGVASPGEDVSRGPASVRLPRPYR